MVHVSTLGENCQLEHENIGVLAKKLNINKVFVFGDFSKYTMQAFYGETKDLDLIKFADKEELVNNLLDYLKSIDEQCTVLIKGSNYMKMWEVSDSLKIALAN